MKHKRQNSTPIHYLPSTILFSSLLLFYSTPAYAAATLPESVGNMIRELAGTILGLSSAAAVVGVGTGALFKMFSLGKPDRMETGNKIMVNSIWGWILVNGATFIFDWAGSYIGNGVTAQQIIPLP